MIEEKPRITPTTITEARAFVDRHHRHHRAPVSGLFAVALSVGGDVVGVAIAGRPVARMSDNGYTIEVTRLAVIDGIKNGCSMLYGAIVRASFALGYQRVITYTLAEEGGGSLRASGWRCLGERGGGSWSRTSRPRVDMHPTQVKMGWEKSADFTPASKE